MTTAAEVAAAIGGKPSGNGWIGRCPCHNDDEPSLSIGEGSDGTVLLHCHAGCSQERLVDWARSQGFDLSGRRSNRFRRRGERNSEPRQEEPRRKPARCDVATYAAKLKLPVDFLKEAGLADGNAFGMPVVRIPYFDDSGTEVATRYRIRIDGPDKFRWKKGGKPVLYGLTRIAEARHKGEIVLVEGKSDYLTLWFEGFAAIALPGASTWREDRDARHFDGFRKIWVVIEPDQGGDTMLAWIAGSSIRDRVALIRMPEATKDPAALYQSNPAEFATAWEKMQTEALPWSQHAAASQMEELAAARVKAARLLAEENILREVVLQTRRLGVIGEPEIVQLAYLVMTTRVLDRIVSLIVKGPSSSGKSFVIQQMLRLFSVTSYIARTGMSERALIYGNAPLSHRMLVFYEAAALTTSDYLTYVVRTLVSEGRLSYEYVSKNAKGESVTHRIEREGPTGLILTTTAITVDPETETRCISVTANDSPEQTAAIMKHQAALTNNPENAPDLSEWHALQTVLDHTHVEVVIPYIEALPSLIPPAAVRLRRDFPTLIALIKAHALLHQGTRRRDERGAVVAELLDYARVARLVAGLIGDTAGVTTPQTIQQTRMVVAKLLAADDRMVPREFVTTKEVAKELGLDHSAAYRRIADALKRGLLRHWDENKPKPFRIALGDAVEDSGLLPTRQTLEEAWQRTGDK